MAKGARRARRSGRQKQRSSQNLSAYVGKLGRELQIGNLEKLKPWLIGLLSLIALPLLGYYVVERNIFSQYALTLSFISAVLIIWALPRLRLGLSAAYLFVMPLWFYLGNTEYGYSKAIFSLWVISLLIVMWVMETLLKPDERLNLTRLLWPGLALLGAALLSLIHSQVFWGDFQYIGLLFYFFIFALLMAHTIQSREDFHFLLGSLLASGALAALYGLLQYYGRLLGTPGFGEGTEAILSSFGNKNYVAGFLAYLFAPGLVLIFGKTPWLTKTLVLLELALIYMGLLAASSYSAWLGLILALVFVLVALWFYKGVDLFREHLGWASALLGTLTLALLFYLMTTVAWVNHEGIDWATIRTALIKVAPAWGTFILLPLFLVFGLASRLLQALRHRWGWALVTLALLVALGVAVTSSRWGQQSLIGPIFSKLSYAASVGARFEDWQVGSLMFRDHPLIGIGLGEYKRQFLPYKELYLQTPQGQMMNARVGYIPRAAQAHNEYLQIAAEMGLLGLLASALLIMMVFWSTLRRVPSCESPTQQFTLLTLLGGVVAFLSDAFFSFPLHLPANALVLAFLLGALYAPALGAKPWEVRLRPVAKRALASGLIILAVVVSVLSYRDFVSDAALNSAKEAFSRGAYQAAFGDLQTSVALDIQAGENLLWLAQLETAQGDTAQAQGDTAQAQGDTAQAKALYAQAKALYAQAKALYLRSLKSFNTEEGYYHLAALYVKDQDYQDAARYLDQLLAMDPEPNLKLQAQYLRAAAAVQQQDCQGAVALLAPMVKAHPDFEPAYLLLGQCQLQQGQYDTATKTLTTAHDLIDLKLAEVNKVLNPQETVNLPLQQYSQAKADQARLQKEQETVEQLLKSIPPPSS